MMFRFKLFLFVFLVAFGVNAHAATYYVDQTGGNDGNAGTGTAAPWKNCPGMSSYGGSGSLKPGDIVYFDRGDTWLVSGAQGLYLVGGVTYIGDSWGSGTRATIKANGDCDAGVVRFRDHATSATVFKGFNVDANKTVSTGIDINHKYWQLMNGATKRVENCEVHNTWSRQVSGQYKYGIIMSNFGGTAGYTENVEIINTVVHDTSRDAICLYPGDANADCRIKNITVRGCEAYNTGQDPDYSAGAGILVKGYVQDAYIEYNSVHNTHGAGIFVNGNETNHYGVGPTNIHFRYNIVNNPNANGGIRIYDTGADPKDIKIYGNIVLNNTVSGGISLANNSGTLKLLVYNNVFYNAFVRFTDHSSVVNALEFRNNIIYSTSDVPLIANSGNIKQSSNNIYYRGSGTLVTIGGTSYTSSNLSSFEATASSSNPSFKDTGKLPTGFTGTYGVNLAPNNDGLSLQQGSQGLSDGIALATTYNSSVNSVARLSGAWDIGAYQFGTAGSAARPNPPSNLIVQ